MGHGNNNTLIVAAGLFASLSVLLLGLVGYFTYQASGQLAQLSSELQELQREEASVIGLRTLLKETSETREKLDRYTVKRSSIVPYIEEIEGVARDAGLVVDVRTVTTGGAMLAPGERVGEVLNLEFEVRGPFAGVMETIYRLEVLPFAAVIHSIRLEYVDNGEWATYLRIDGVGYINDEE